MELFSFLLILGGIFGVLFVLDRLMKKWFAIDEEVLQSAPAKKIESWTRWTTFIAMLCLFPIVGQDMEAYIFWLLAVFTVITMVAVYFEWRWLKGSRKYQMSLVSYGLVMLAILAMLSFQ